MRDYLAIAAQYVDDILAGEIPACLYIRQACERFQRDLERDDIYLDVEDATRWMRNKEKLKHVAGRQFAGKPFILEPWQVFHDLNVYGWKWVATGLRRFTLVFTKVPRKNGKSTWKATDAIGALTWEKEPGAEVYCGATDKDQAKKVFQPCRLMVNQAKGLKKQYGLEVGKNAITRASDESVLRPIVGKPGDGDFPSLHICDEYHEHKDDSQVSTMANGMGSRDQPLQMIITTAGEDVGGPCYQLESEAIDMLAGIYEDDSFFAMIFGLDINEIESQWDTWEAFQKANPNWHLMNKTVILNQIERARRSPQKQADYKTKKLNIWVGSKAGYFNLLDVQRCRSKELTIDDYIGQDCFAGLDLASRIDIASYAKFFPGTDNLPPAAFIKNYLPERRVQFAENKRYKQWADAGWFTVTEGNLIDYETICKDIENDYKLFNVRQSGIDPHQDTKFVTDMASRNIEIVEFRQITANLSEPMKELEGLITDTGIRLTMCPVLFWAFGNVINKSRLTDLAFPGKQDDTKKIDPVVALIIAIGQSLGFKTNESIWNKIAKEASA